MPGPSPSRSIVHLPVDGRAVRLRPLDGAAELLAAEARDDPARAALRLLSLVAEPVDGSAGDAPETWAELSVTDFEALLLALRRELFGAWVRSDFTCPAPACGERVEMEFSLTDYLAAVRPRRPRGVVADAARPGWWRTGDIAFRLPSAEDQIAAQASPDGAALLAGRCLDPPAAPASLRARAERAMAAMAPEVSGPIGGQCPGCGAPLSALFHAPSFVMGELRRAVGLLTEEVDLIACAYHWSEAAILALPRARRQAYAERIRRRLAA
jgi:hypothetical protein